MGMKKALLLGHLRTAIDSPVTLKKKYNMIINSGNGYTYTQLLLHACTLNFCYTYTLFIKEAPSCSTTSH